MFRSAVTCGFALFLCFFWVAVAAAQPASAAPKISNVSGEARMMQRALEMIQKRPQAVDAVRIEVEAWVEDRQVALTVYGTGQRIWNHREQLTVEPEEVLAALELFREIDFPSLPDAVAGDPDPTPVPEGTLVPPVPDAGPMSGTKPTPKPKPGKAEPNAAQLVRLVTLAMGPLQKTVLQDNKRLRHEPFYELTEELLKRFSKRDDEPMGVVATDLRDGLQKIADGVLIPQLLTVTASAPELRWLRGANETQGWMLTIANGIMETKTHSLRDGWGGVRPKRLQPSDVTAIAKLLVAEGLPDLPPNVIFEGYTDISVSVLDHKLSVQGRSFARPEDAAMKKAQKSFGAVRTFFLDLHQGVMEHRRPLIPEAETGQ